MWQSGLKIRTPPHLTLTQPYLLTYSVLQSGKSRLLQGKAVNREDKLSRRHRDRDLAKFESSRRYRQR